MKDERNIIEAVAFSAEGVMWLLDIHKGKIKEYVYFGITEDIKNKVNRFGRGKRKQRGKIYQLLKPYSYMEKWEFIKMQKAKGVIL